MIAAARPRQSIAAPIVDDGVAAAEIMRQGLITTPGMPAILHVWTAGLGLRRGAIMPAILIIITVMVARIPLRIAIWIAPIEIVGIGLSRPHERHRGDGHNQ